MRRNLVAGLVAIPVGLALVLGTEVLIAVSRPRLPPRDPLVLDGLIGASHPHAPITMAWIGNSVAAGVGARSRDAALPRLVAARLGRPVKLHVVAASGERAAGALVEQVPVITALDPPPDIVVVEIGANDVTHLTGTSDFRRGYERILAAVTDAGPRHVLALGIPAFGTTPRFLQPLRAVVGWRAGKLDEEIRAAASTHGATYVDIAGETGPAFAADPDRYYAEDDFHPSDAGYELWADAVLKHLRSLVVAGDALGVTDSSRT